jgi:hypothetical protein
MSRRKDEREVQVPLTPDDDKYFERERERRRLSRQAFGRILLRFGLMNLDDAMASSGKELPPEKP